MTQPFPGGLTAPQEWLDGLVPWVPNVGVDAIKHEVLQVLRDFFQRSEAWRDWMGPVVLYSDAVEYSPELADYKAEIINVLDMYRASDGQQLSVVTRNNIGAYRNIMEPGTPQYYHLTPRGMLQIWPPPVTDAGETVYPYVSMKPIDLCVPDWIRSKHYDAIVNGVLGRLYAKPGPQKDMGMAQWYQKRYVAERNDATRDAISNSTALVEIARPRMIMGGSQRSRAGRATNATSW